MIFEKLQGDPITKYIDGNAYIVSNNANVDWYNCKEAIVEIFNMLDPQMMEVELDFNEMNNWRKKLISKLKAWDKIYLKHIKTVYPEMSQLHAEAMKPLTLLIDSNL